MLKTVIKLNYIIQLLLHTHTHICLFLYTGLSGKKRDPNETTYLSKGLNKYINC